MTTECTFNEKVFLTLNEENQEKVEHIYAIASTLREFGLPRLTAKEFDDLYDRPASELEAISGIVTLRIQAIMFAHMAREINRGRG